MKTNLTVMALSVGLMSLPLCVGCNPPSARAQDAPEKAEPTPPVVAAADEPKAAEPKPADPKPTEPAAAPAAPLEAPAPGVAVANPVQMPVPPDQLKLTPALEDVIKLVQAGVGEEVLMSYITNSTGIFNMGPNEILYLHDLGVPGPVITSLIQQDSTPEAMARKQAVNAVQPLPPGVALNKPASNIFTPRSTPPPQTAVSPETAEVITDLPADTNAIPPAIYTVPTVAQEPANVSYFYTELAPYGTWVDYPGYGRCWRPTVSVWNSSWRPYCDGGRWLWTDCGWYWYSDYSWGASTFHYGRWTCPSGYGWLWVPDTCWGPSWVSWRHTRSHCAWAPLPPSARYVSGRGWYHNTLSVGADHDFGLSKDAYVALPKNQLLSRRPSSHYLSARHAEAVIGDSSVANHYATVNKTVVNHGVGFDAISKASGGNIRQVSIRSADAVGPRNPRRELLDADGKTLTVARPAPGATVIRPPVQPISSLSGQRTRSERTRGTAVAGPPQAPIANGAGNSLASGTTPAASTGPTVVPSGRAGAPIAMRGNGRPAGVSSTASAVAPPVTGQPATTPDSGGKPPGITASRALPGGRRPAADSSERSRSSPQVVVAKPRTAVPAGPTPAPQPNRTIVARTEPSRTAPQPIAIQRVPAGPAPVQLQPVAPAPVRIAPSGPAGPTVSPRVDSYRAPAPGPSPAVRAPAPSSSSSSRPSYSRDSSGAPRGSR